MNIPASFLAFCEGGLRQKGMPSASPLDYAQYSLGRSIVVRDRSASVISHSVSVSLTR